MHVVLTDHAKEDYCYWRGRDDKMISRIGKLINDIKLHPFEGLGKPEPLKHHLSGLWSRRITREHRLVYTVKDNTIIVYQCRFHYGKR